MQYRKQTACFDRWAEWSAMPTRMSYFMWANKGALVCFNERFLCTFRYEETNTAPCSVGWWSQNLYRFISALLSRVQACRKLKPFVMAWHFGYSIDFQLHSIKIIKPEHTTKQLPSFAFLSTMQIIHIVLAALSKPYHCGYCCDSQHYDLFPSSLFYHNSTA